MVGSSLSSSLSSFSNDRHEFYKLVRMADEAHQRYSTATHKAGQFDLCLDTVGVALSTSERETAAAQAVTIDAQARIMGKGSLHLDVLFGICNF